MKDLETLYLECDCGDAAHLIKFTFVAEDYEDPYVYMATQMSPRHRWYTRIWLAVRYIFGGQSRFGYWECTSLDCEKLKALNTFISNSITECEKERNYN